MSAITDYLDSLPDNSEKAVLMHMYDVVRQTVPEAEETIYYGMPSFKLAGRGLVSILATKKFLSLYPYSGLTGETLERELAVYERTKGSIHFSPEQRIPDALLQLILKTRIAEIAAATSK